MAHDEHNVNTGIMSILTEKRYTSKTFFRAAG